MADYLTGFDNNFLSQFEQMRQQMNYLFGDPGGPAGIRSVVANTYPAINVGVSAKQVDVYVFAAGLDKQKLEISLQQNLLTVTGERELEQPEGGQTHRRERFSGVFKRTLALPEDVNPEKVDAVYRDGVLHITVQRKEELQPRKIEVN